MACAALGALICAPGALGHGKSTLEQTIVGGDKADAFQYLRIGPGEPYAVRTDLLEPRPGRKRRRHSLAYFGQISDFQLSDEESPARVEFTDQDPSGFASSAWRPQEAMVVHQVDQSVRNMNRFRRSPVPQGDGSHARLLNAVMTGDLADNMQRNETQWVVQVLEGGLIDPNSGTSDQCDRGTPADDPSKYTGVQDYDDYFASEAFYDPDQPIGQYANWPAYPGLMDRAQQPFEAQGLAVPWYSAFGNHDGLVQGNEDARAEIEDIATGCVKPFTPNPTDPTEALNPDVLASLAGTSFLVPPDPARQFVDKVQFKELHATGKQADDHGFGLVDEDELAASNGAAAYYSWTPTRGVRFIVLDTLSEGGVVGVSSSGNLDDPQWQWLERELDEASARDELIVVFGHHATASLSADVPDEAASGCSDNDEHGHDRNPGCDRDPRSSEPLHLGDDLEALLLEHPHVLAYVAGHSHENRIAPFGDESGFWEIKSPAIVDWPPQHRVIDVMDNCDGTLSLFTTMLDHDAPIAAPGAGPAGGFSSAELAAIGRTLSYNDPQVDQAGSSGEPTDRNTELLLADPRTSRPADPKLSLRVKPKRVRAGRRTRLRFRVRSAGKPVRGAIVRFKGKRKRTNRKGVARMRVRLERPRRARVRKRLGCTTRRASARVRLR
jgi:metallophosphoesterase (TIGR03767 family)